MIEFGTLSQGWVCVLNCTRSLRLRFLLRLRLWLLAITPAVTWTSSPRPLALELALCDSFETLQEQRLLERNAQTQCSNKLVLKFCLKILPQCHQCVYVINIDASVRLAPRTCGWQMLLQRIAHKIMQPSTSAFSEGADDNWGTCFACLKKKGFNGI